MKTDLARPLVFAVLVCMLLAAGCVSDAQYKEALAASRRAQEQLTTCMSALRDMRTENQRLLSDIEARDGVIAARDKALAELQSNHDKLNLDFKTLYDKYQKAIEGAGGPAPIGMVLPPLLDKALREFAAANPDLVEYLPNYGMVKLKSDLTFDKGSVEIKKTSGEALRKFVAIMNSEAAQRFHVYIAGHTDDIPVRKPTTLEHHPDNWYLSVHRSVAVQKVLAAGGLDAKRIGVMGFSEYHPVAPNAPGNKGNQLNRRVEIWIVPPDRFLTASGE
jgi:flagellar motor protein MotB